MQRSCVQVFLVGGGGCLAEIIAGQVQAAGLLLADDPELRKRVRLQWIPVWFTFMFRWDDLLAEAKGANGSWPFDGTHLDLHADLVELAAEHDLNLKGLSSPIAF